MRNTALPRNGDPKVDDLVNRIEDAINALEAHLFAGMVLVTQVIGTTDTRVYHGLGRAPVGYILVRTPSNNRIFDGLVPEATDPANYITLRSSVAGSSLTLVVF